MVNASSSQSETRGTSVVIHAEESSTGIRHRMVLSDQMEEELFTMDVPLLRAWSPVSGVDT